MNSSFGHESADESRQLGDVPTAGDISAPAWFRPQRRASTPPPVPPVSTGVTAAKPRTPVVRIEPDSASQSDAELPESWLERLWAVLWCPSAHSYYTSLFLHATLLMLLLAIVLPHHVDDVGGINAVLEDDDGLGDAGLFDEEIPDTVVEVQQASAEPPPENLPVSELVSSALTGRGTGVADINLRLPKGGKAVTRGSFTAWTIPEDPLPGQQYRIVIQVKLPPRLKRYRLSDLAGRVVGTDRYRQELPVDDEKPSMTRVMRRGQLVVVRRSELLPIRDNTVELIVFIPGADNLVRDTIHIESKILKEKQTLEIVF